MTTTRIPSGTSVLLPDGTVATRAALAGARDPVLPWYSALERLADELRVDVDRAAIKAEALAVIGEGAWAAGGGPNPRR